MLARVTTWEGATPEGIRTASEEMRSRVEHGPPPGIESTGITVLVDPERGRTLIIGLFESAEELRASEPVLEAMDVPPGFGTRSSVEVWELATEVRLLAGQ